MKKIITILFFCVSFNLVMGQQNDSISNNESNNEITSSLIDNKTTDGEKLAIREALYEMRKENDKEFTDFFTKYFTFWMAFGGIIGSIVGFFVMRDYYRERLIGIIDRKITNKVEISQGHWANEIKQLEKHYLLKKKTKIKLIQKDEIPEDLLKILSLFNFNKEEDVITVENLKDAYNNENLEKLKQADVIVIENKVPENVWSTATYKEEYIELAEKICPFAALAYYGDEHFPIAKFKSGYKYLHKITFANSASQFYGNLLNMLKYLNEIGELDK